MEEMKKKMRDEYQKGFIGALSIKQEDELMQFIEQQIDLAVSKERSRIVEGIEKLSGYYRHPMALFPKERTTQEELKEMTIKEEIINLINTK